MDVIAPNLDRYFIGEEKPFSGVIVIELAGRGLWGEPSENVPRREVEMVPSRAEELAQRPFARPRGAKNQDRSKGVARLR